MQRSTLRWWLGGALLAASLVALAPAVDLGAVAATFAAARAEPFALTASLAAYVLAFGIRAELWRRALPAIGFGHAMAGLHVGLAGNHVLPFRLGEVLRPTTVARRTGVPLSAAAASTVALRAADVLAVVLLGALLGPRAVAGVAGSAGWLVAVPAALGLVAGLVWMRRAARARGVDLRLAGGWSARWTWVLTAAGATVAWLLESVLVYLTARWAGIALDPADAVLVTAVTIAAQVVALTPGGIGTYEAAATAAFVALGASPQAGLAAAVTAHAIKTVYALAAGAVAVAVPAPGLVGRLRLPRRRPPRPAPLPTAEGAPVVLFLPAHDEEDAVGEVVRRVPAEVAGRPVVCLVVDDGSTDATASVAAEAGALVVSQPRNLGLGAAVRRGLAEGAAMGAAAVAFCDADGEYAPEELERLVASILDGGADYVVGSRFAGGPRDMRPHRWLGNRVLTAAVRVAARAPVTDGQSGYRALSPAAAAEAEIVHDYNYAQVLTLDLLGKGFVYAEVPISYRFRRTGTSFVRLGAYLRRVLPAVHRELNAPAPAPSPADPRPVGTASA